MKYGVLVKTLIREPLVTFILIGSLFFAAFNLSGNKGVDENKTIVVDRASLLRFLQLKSKTVDQRLLVRSFDAMPGSERKNLIAEYVQEEALYREAQSIGLDKDDPVIKGRVLQKLAFITQEYSEAILKVNDAQLEQYYSINKQDYVIESSITFTHVFYDRTTHGDELARKLAVDKLQELNNNNVSFSEGLKHGERFPYHVNYVERTADLVSSHFGQEMSTQIFGIPTMADWNERSVWRGPYASPYGSHLVMVSAYQESRFPKLDEVVGQVYRDAQREQTRKSLDEAYKAIVNTYSVELSEDLSSETEDTNHVSAMVAE